MSADLRWLRNAEHWGDGWMRFDETTGERESIWLLKSTSGPQARFYARGKGQIGPRHMGVYHAICWAYGTGYLPADAYQDNAQMFLALACRAEVLAGAQVLFTDPDNGRLLCRPLPQAIEVVATEHRISEKAASSASPLVPVGFASLGRKRCSCGATYWTLSGYQGHYAYAHILAMEES
ncbi:MAG: hypothetical protein ACRDOJ_05090 [Nocardioidaceae bacterium]